MVIKCPHSRRSLESCRCLSTKSDHLVVMKDDSYLSAGNYTAEITHRRNGIQFTDKWGFIRLLGSCSAHGTLSNAAIGPSLCLFVPVVSGSILCDPIQPNPLQVKKIEPNPTQPNTTNNGAYSLVVTNFYTQNLFRSFSQPSINLLVFSSDRYTY